MLFQEANQYIENIRAVHGAFNLTSSTLVPFEPAKWVNYLSEMIAKQVEIEKIYSDDVQSPAYESVSDLNQKIKSSASTSQYGSDENNDNSDNNNGGDDSDASGASDASDNSDSKPINSPDKNEQLTNKLVQTSNVHHQSTENCAKKRRTTMDDGEIQEFSENWYTNMENLVKADLGQIFRDIKQYNGSSYKKIVELNVELKNVNSAKDALEAKVTDLNRQQRESAERENILQTKIRKLEEEKNILVKSISCKDCGSEIKTVQFCNNECIENNIK